MTEPLWTPGAARVAAAEITRFARFAESRHGQALPDYETLWRWSVGARTSFWNDVWDFCDVIGDKGSERVLVDAERMPGARFFPDARLNFAENLLRFHGPQTAIVSRLENGRRRELSRDELRRQVAALTAEFRAHGIGAGDRVAAFMPNVPETIVCMLAAASLGATFSSCSPDFGVNGVFDRFGQIRPKLLMACDGYYYNGKTIDSRDTVAAIRERIDSIEATIAVSVTGEGLPDATAFDDIVAARADAALRFTRLPFDHPLYIMYSSGTTGVPKCIVHGAGGTLLQHLKEHRLHTDLGDGDVLFYFTTCGWMMWNWLASGLASGATLVLYDGSPFRPGPRALMDMADEESISIFGTSAKYIAALEKAEVRPRETHRLERLKAILSTGSPLSHQSFRYVYRDIKADLCLSSISGGTDIVSCFALGNPTLPVYAGELQCRGLGMAVEIWDDDGNSVVGEKGELVCTAAFPSMPVGFFNDPDGSRLRAAYFDRYPGVWAHGDYGEITEHGGVIIHGRSDAVLNPGGVRIGTAEIYRQVEKVAEVLDSVCIGQGHGDDVRVVLFVVLREGVELTDALQKTIRDTIRRETTPRHVPARIVQVTDIPRTISGKIVELAVRNVVHGEPVKNTDALANPEALEQFRDRPELDD